MVVFDDEDVALAQTESDGGEFRVDAQPFAEGGELGLQGFDDVIASFAVAREWTFGRVLEGQPTHGDAEQKFGEIDIDTRHQIELLQ